MKNFLIILCVLCFNITHAQTDIRYITPNVTNSTATGIVNHDSNIIFDNDGNAHGALTIINDTQEIINGNTRGLYTELMFDLENYYGYGKGIIFHDGRETLKAGIEYAETGYVTKLHSLTDKEYVDTTKPILVSLNSDPSGKPDGFIYYNVNTNKIRVKINGVWFSLLLE